jgi:hypothetical protein
MWRCTGVQPGPPYSRGQPGATHPWREDAVPAHVIVLVQAQVVHHLVPEVGRQLGLEEGTHLVAKGQVVARIIQVHGVSTYFTGQKSTTVPKIVPEIVH